MLHQSWCNTLRSSVLQLFTHQNNVWSNPSTTTLKVKNTHQPIWSYRESMSQVSFLCGGQENTPWVVRWALGNLYILFMHVYFINNIRILPPPTGREVAHIQLHVAVFFWPGSYSKLWYSLWRLVQHSTCNWLSGASGPAIIYVFILISSLENDLGCPDTMHGVSVMSYRCPILDKK